MKFKTCAESQAKLSITGTHHKAVRMLLARQPIAADVAQVVIRADRAAHARPDVDLQPASVTRRREARRLKRQIILWLTPLAGRVRQKFGKCDTLDVVLYGTQSGPVAQDNAHLRVVQVVQDHHAAVLGPPNGVELVVVPLRTAQQLRTTSRVVCNLGSERCFRLVRWGSVVILDCRQLSLLA